MNAYARIYQMHAAESTVSMLQAILRGWTTCPPMHPMLLKQLRHFLELLHGCNAARVDLMPSRVFEWWQEIEHLLCSSQVSIRFALQCHMSCCM